jgi:hypothetical protein
MNDDLRTQLYNLMYELDTRAPKVWLSLVNAWLGEVAFFREVDGEWDVTDDATDEQVEMLIAEVRDALDALDDSTGNPDHPAEADAQAHDTKRLAELRERILYNLSDNGGMYVTERDGALVLLAYLDSKKPCWTGNGMTISDALEAVDWCSDHRYLLRNPEYLMYLIGGA